jgi:hypothetical protein
MNAEYRSAIAVSPPGHDRLASCRRASAKATATEAPNRPPVRRGCVKSVDLTKFIAAENVLSSLAARVRAPYDAISGCGEDQRRGSRAVFVVV